MIGNGVFHIRHKSTCPWVTSDVSRGIWYRYTGMGAQIIGAQIIVKWRKKWPINIWRLLLSPKFQRKIVYGVYGVFVTFDGASMWNKIKNGST